MKPTRRLLVTTVIFTGLLIPGIANAQRRARDRGRNEPDIQYRRNRNAAMYYLSSRRGVRNSGRFYTRGNNHYYIPQRQWRRDGPLNAQRFPFGGYSHVPELARRLESIINSTALDMYHNYAQNRNFQNVYRRAYELLQLAEEVHETTLQANGKDDVQRAIRGDVRRMDRLFHRLRQDTKDWTRRQNVQVGQRGIFRKYQAIDTILHHLMYDIGLRPSGPNHPRANQGNRYHQRGNDNGHHHRPREAPRPGAIPRFR